MDLQERLSEIIAEGNARIAEEARLDREFREGWEALRHGALHQTLLEAKEPFKQLGASRVVHSNGCCDLELYPSREQYPDYVLHFCEDKKARQVVCNTNLERFPEERFSLDALDADRIRDKIVSFAKAIFDHRLSRR